MTKVDAKVSLVERTPSVDGLPTNSLRVRIKGSSVNYTIVNTIRRIVLSLVPSYAFDPEDIVIEKNTSVFNNDYMRLRLSNLPIINPSYDKMVVPNDEAVLENVLTLEDEVMSSLSTRRIDSQEANEKKKQRRAELLDNLHMRVGAKNESASVNMAVTTNDPATTSFYVKGDKIDTIYPRPVLLIKLKPRGPGPADGDGEEFKATCMASLNIPLKSAIYSTCAVCAYEEVNEHEFVLEIESRRQIPEEAILARACRIAVLKLRQVHDKVIKAIKDKPQAKHEAELVIEKENHTMGNPLTRALQDHPDIEFCGYKIDHLCVNEVTLRYKTNGKDFLPILTESVDHQINVFTKLADQFDKL
jgi:DNA-directed RNA polymerase subunit L